MKFVNLENRAILGLTQAINRAKEARHLNPLIIETFDLAQKQWKNAERIGKKPFTMVIKDCFA